MAVAEAVPGGATMRSETQRGVLAALAANLWWGFLPLLFYLLDGVDAVEVVAARTACSLIVVGAIIWAGRRFGEVKAVLADRRTALTLLCSALLLAANWLVYVYSVQSNHLLEGSFGYFMNPLVNVGMGMVLLGERQSRWQMAALALAVVALGVQAIGLGTVPYISLALAATFGTYGYLRKTVRANSATGLFVETLLLTPLALAYIGYAVATRGPGPWADPRLLALLLATGPATAVPLLLFAFFVQRLRLTTVGMFQYISPSIQFALAITFFGEELNLLRLLSFALVWVALAVFSADSLRRQRAAVVARAFAPTAKT